MSSKKFLILFLFVFLICSLVLPKMLMSGTNEITGINVEEAGAYTEIKIDSNSQFSYTMYKPEDPYSAVVELHGVGLGKLKDKIVFDKAGVMEIIPSISEVDKTTVRLEITFSIPAEIEPVQKGSGLVLKFYNPESEEAIAATEEEPTVLAKNETGKEESKKSPAKEASIIENIEFVKSADRVNVLISGDGQMSPKVSQIDSNKLVVDIPNVATMVESVKTYEPPVLGIRIGEYLDKTSIVFDIAESTKYDVTTGEKQIVVSFEQPAAKIQVVKSEPPAKIEALSAKLEAEAFTSKEYTGEKISLDFQDADLIHIFRLLADVSGYNIVVSPQVKGKFSMKLIDVPWDQALDIILRNYGLSRTVVGNIIRIAPTDIIAQEEEDIAKAKEASEKAGDLVTRVYPINY
ncbi:MAG: AMIN domain-containing protein, partial [Nitrospirota bacterium]